jgi:hypothetical protein
VVTDWDRGHDGHPLIAGVTRCAAALAAAHLPNKRLTTLAAGMGRELVRAARERTTTAAKIRIQAKISPP